MYLCFDDEDIKMNAEKTRKLMFDLKSDINLFGVHLMVDVITEEKDGRVIYKDYMNMANGFCYTFPISMGEKWDRLPATDLLEKYRIQAEILD